MSKIQSSILTIQKNLLLLTVLLMAAGLMPGCDSSTSANNDQDGEEKKKETVVFDLILAADNSTKTGTAETEIITEEDDAYIDEGFFVTLDITISEFEAPYDLFIDSGGHCGTFDVRSGDKAEMPCDYDRFLDNPSILTITSEDGDGESAHPVRQK